MKKGGFITLIAVGVLALAAIGFVGGGVGTKNTAISYEEKIGESLSNIEVERKSAVNKLTLMESALDSSNAQYDKVIAAIAAARGTTDSSAVTTAVNLIVEAYPENLGNQELYKTYMNEIIIINDSIGNYRELYNSDVKEYKIYCRKFPNSMFLSIFGYDTVDYNYLTVTVESDL